jgi:ATP-dependent helicase IRC3
LANNPINKTVQKLTLDQGPKTPEWNADVIVASVNTLGRKHTHRLHSYFPNDFKCIIIDEAHHAAAKSYQRIMDHFDVLNPDSKIFLCKLVLLYQLSF